MAETKKNDISGKLNLGMWGFGLAIAALVLVIIIWIWYLVDRQTFKDQGYKRNLMRLSSSTESVTPNGGDSISTTRPDLKINKPGNDFVGRSFTVANLGEGDLVLSGGSGNVSIVGGDVTIPKGLTSSFIWVSNSNNPEVFFQKAY